MCLYEGLELQFLKLFYFKLLFKWSFIWILQKFQLVLVGIYIFFLPMESNFQICSSKNSIRSFKQNFPFCMTLSFFLAGIILSLFWKFARIDRSSISLTISQRKENIAFAASSAIDKEAGSHFACVQLGHIQSLRERNIARKLSIGHTCTCTIF